ncbi:Holliday junction resolvase RuvX [bacterium]|nr:MAG: Holliday junction resolvase RuvX [bacterium]
MSKILGIDIGKKYIGVAISDANGKIALPCEVLTVESAHKIAEQIAEFARKLLAEKIVVGLPLHLSGEESPMSQFARKIAEQLRYMGFDAILYDERFSSAQAERVMRAAGEKPSLNKKQVNKISATLILQSYLDTPNL